MQPAEEIKSITFGGYLLLERLAMGGMAEVFLGRPDGQERFVAIKRILPGIAADDDFIAMFIDEAKIAGQLTHPNIAQILDIGKISSSYFIAMEYVSGHDLRALWDRVREQPGADARGAVRGLPIAVACHIVKKLAEGLDHAHRKRDSKGRPLGIIHRDVSPQNILISYDGDLKIIDFGIAKAANRIVKTQTGILKGKFAYMAPEQARGEPIDHRSDIFAMGVVLYELLTGERAFKGDTDFVLLDKVRRVEVVPARELRPDLPRELERIMMKALGREAADRYAWASVLAGDLDRFMSDQGLTTSRDELGSFVRRVFRAEHAEEHRRLGLYRRGGEGADGVDSAGSVVRGASVVAKNSRGRAQGAEAQAEDSTAVAMLAIQPTALADVGMGVRDGQVNVVDDRRASEGVDTRRSLRRKRELAAHAHDRADAENRARYEDGRGVGAPGDIVDRDDANALAAVKPTKAPSSAAPGATAPADTGSLRRRRTERGEARLPPPADVSVGAGLDHVEEPPPLVAEFVNDGDGRSTQRQRPGVGNGVIVAACLLGALLGAGLATGVAVVSRAPPPDTLFVVTPRQSEVRVNGAVICAQTPCAVHLGPGRHDVLLQAPGLEAVSRTVEVGAGAAVVDVTLDRVARAVRVETVPAGATVLLDDVPLADPTPVTLPPLPVGKTVRLTMHQEGHDMLTVVRMVESDDVWRYELPTPTTQWTVTTVPSDAVVEMGRVVNTGATTVTVGSKAVPVKVPVKVQRPGCVPQQFTLSGNGKAKASRIVTLQCGPMDATLAVLSPRRPLSVRIDGIQLPRGAPLDGYALPAGTYSISIVTSRGKRDAGTVLLSAGERREFHSR